MANSSVHNFSLLINEQESLLINLIKAKSISNLLLNIDLRKYPFVNLHSCLDILDGFLDEVHRHATQCESLSRVIRNGT